MNADDVKVYYFDDYRQEAHMAGDVVAVCWNYTIEKERRTLTGPDGLTYHATAQVRKRTDQPPYIDFVEIGDAEANGSTSKADGNPIDSGLGAEDAKHLVRELTWAIAYLEANS